MGVNPVETDARCLPRKRYRGFESPLSALESQESACRDPVQVAGFSRLSGEFGGKSGAKSTAATCEVPAHT